MSTTSLSTTTTKCTLAAFAALCCAGVMHHTWQVSNRMDAQAERLAPYLADTPATRDDSMEAHETTPSLPIWRGVVGSMRHTEIRLLRSTGDSTMNPWKILTTSRPGQSLDVDVRPLASSVQAVGKDRSSNIKHHDWTLIRAQHLVPAWSSAQVQGSVASTTRVQAQPDGSLHVHVDAIPGEVQTAWIYPKSAQKNPDRTWTVQLQVGAAPQHTIDTFESIEGKVGGLRFLSVLFLLGAIGSAGHGVASVLRHLREQREDRENHDDTPSDGGPSLSRTTQTAPHQTLRGSPTRLRI